MRRKKSRGDKNKEDRKKEDWGEGRKNGMKEKILDVQELETE
jgi:hypothetical protein